MQEDDEFSRRIGEIKISEVDLGRELRVEPDEPCPPTAKSIRPPVPMVILWMK